MTSGIWSVGSVTDYVGAVVGWTNIPAGVSGTVLSNMVEQEINYVELFTTDTIDSSAIPEKYQPSIVQLTQADLLLSIDSNSGGIGDVELGELNVKGNDSSYAELSKQLRESAIRRLKELQRTTRFKRVIGCS